MSNSTNADTPLIQVRHLRKHFSVRQRGNGAGVAGRFTRSTREVRAVDDISFDVERGEIVGYVGPNGAGKSTTIKMLTGILTPSDGEAVVNGLVPWKQRRDLARRIGAVFGQRTQLWWDLPLIESFNLLRHIYRIPEARFRSNLAHYREVLDLDPFITTPVRQLSLGQRMRGDLTAALLHDPPMLYLDEPTIGLDVVAKARVRTFLQTMQRERGVTVLLTTHDMDDIQHLCSRMLIIDHGQLLYDGSVEAIRQRFGGERTLVVDLDGDQANDVPLVVPGAVQVRADGPRRWLQFQRDQTSAAALIGNVSAAYRVRDLTLEEPDIEGIVRRIYEAGTLSGRPSTDQ